MDINNKINSEQEYWIEHAKFKKSLRKTRTSDDFETLMDNAQKIGLFAKEDIIKLKKDFYHQIGQVYKYADKLSWIKNTIKKKLKY